MNSIRKIAKLCLLFGLTVGLIISVASCGNPINTEADSNHIPFSDMKWSSNSEDLLKLYGEYSDQYESSYGGPCYVYEGIEYEGIEGNVRYFFDESDTLVCVEFYSNFATAEELDSAFQEEKERLTASYGDSDFQVNESGTKGEGWYRAEGNIGILSISFFARYELQVKYLNSIISLEEDELIEKENAEDEYIENYVQLVDYTVDECSGYNGKVPGLYDVSIRNSGNMEIGNVKILLQFLSPLGEVIDSKEVTVLNIFDGRIKPGYSWKMESDEFFELEDLNDGVDLDRVRATIASVELTQPDREDQKTEEELYIEENLVLLDYKVGMCDSYQGKLPGLYDVSLKNNGNRDIDTVTVTVYFQDEEGRNIAENSFTVIGNIWSPDELKANYSWAMEDNKFYEIKNLADEVDISRYTVEITSIEFS